MSEKDIVVNALLELNDIAQSFSQRLSGVRKDFQKALQKQNEELELQNEAQKLAGHNKELQQNIIMIMRKFGVSGVEALELVEQLIKPKVKASASFEETVKESGKCEEPGDIADVMQDVYTSGEDTNDKQTEHDYKMEIQALANMAKGLREGEIKHIRYVPEENNNSKEHDEILNALIQLSGVGTTKEDLEALHHQIYGSYADPVVFSSGEDPGDTHEPSKGSGTRDYETILKQLDWALDTKEFLSDYRLFNEIKEILKEHQVQNARAEYDIDKHTITNGYIETKSLTGVYDKDAPITMPVEKETKQRINYDALISAVAGHLDVNDWSEFNRLIKEHKELTIPKVVKDND